MIKSDPRDATSGDVQRGRNLMRNQYIKRLRYYNIKLSRGGIRYIVDDPLCFVLLYLTQTKVINWCFITGYIVSKSPVVEYFIVLKYNFKLLVFYLNISFSCYIYAIL